MYILKYRQLEKQGTGNGNGNGKGPPMVNRYDVGRLKNALINVRSHVPFTAVTLHSKVPFPH